MRAMDIDVEFTRSGRTRSIHIKKHGHTSVISASSVTTAPGVTENADGRDAGVTPGDAGVATTKFAASPKDGLLAPEKAAGDACDADDADQCPRSADADEEVEWVV